MNQSKFLAITCNSLKPREKSRVHSAIGFGFASHWLKNWRESFKPITKRSNRNHVITFDGHLKTAPITTIRILTPFFLFQISGLFSLAQALWLLSSLSRHFLCEVTHCYGGALIA